MSLGHRTNRRQKKRHKKGQKRGTSQLARSALKIAADWNMRFIFDTLLTCNPPAVIYQAHIARALNITRVFVF